MKDITVGAYAGDNGEPKVTFTVKQTTTQEPERLIAAISYFLRRTSQQAAHFERKARNNAQLKVGTPGGNACLT